VSDVPWRHDRQVVSFDTKGLDFVLTALFVVLFLEQMKRRKTAFSD
jgi:predicted branched-subunit amino acid permease